MGAAKGRGRAPACKWGALGLCPTPACPHHLRDCGQVIPHAGPGPLMKNEWVPCRERGEPRPCSPEVLRMDSTLVGRKIHFLGVCPFSCGQWGSAPGRQRLPLCSSLCCSYLPDSFIPWPPWL